MDSHFTLMRHAYSRHNRTKDQWKQSHGGKGYKNTPEYQLTKLCP